ncbi:MAG: IPExxxVDY family protein [Gilvibacter sp.]
MATHKLHLDITEDLDPYALLAIHCTQPAYHLAYMLNKKLGISLARMPKDLEVFDQGVELSFPLFEFLDQASDRQINLVGNTSKTKQEQNEQNSGDLFGTIPQEAVKINHLLPEFKQADYFLKISWTHNTGSENVIVSRINEIAQVITAYVVDLPLVKSKANLIFE